MVLIESTQKATRKGGERVNKWLQTLLRRTRGEKGVTLIELLAVIVIIAVIAAIAVPVVLGSIHKSKTNTTKQSMSVIAEALNRYAADNDGKFPSSGGDWVSLSKSDSDVYKALMGTGGTGSQEPFLQQIPKDAWGNDFYYYSSGDSNFELETAKAHGDNVSGDALYMSNKMTAPTDTQQSGHNW